MLKSLLTATVLGMTALPVAAAVMQIEYTGTVTGGFDATDVFGTGATDLTGLTYTMTYTYDTSVGSRYTDPNTDYVYGGYAYPLPSPTTSTLVINGSAVDSNGDYSSYDQRYNDGGTAFAQDLSYQYTIDPVTGAFVVNYNYSYANDLALGLPVDLETPYSCDVADGYGGGGFQILVYDPIGGYTDYAYGNMNVNRVTITQVNDVAPIPLPASVGFLFAALGALVGLRSRRRKLV